LCSSWDAKEQPDRREGMKVSGGHFLALWERLICMMPQNVATGIFRNGLYCVHFLPDVLRCTIINPYKKVPARYASRIMIFISVIITVQLLLITYCVNLQLGFYSFVQAGYNHLLWLIPSIISFGPIISTLIYMALYYSNNFNV